MTKFDENERILEEITDDIRELGIASEAITNEIKIKQIELAAIDKKRKIAVLRRQSLSKPSYRPVRDKVRQRIQVGDTIEILNTYCRFSQWVQVKKLKNAVSNKRKIANYVNDKFGIVTRIVHDTPQGKALDKVFFITDSGKETWRKADNVVVHNDQRGVIVHSQQLDWWSREPDVEAPKYDQV